MANFSFTVDTDPMAHEISTVSKHVDATSAAVVTMQSAVIVAEQEAADHVCKNVNYGFYTLMHSQISQKIAQLTSTVESKLIEMGQQAAALQNLKKRMERDYHMISKRYGKLFGSLNASLQSQIYELDKPVVNLVNRDMQLNDSRIRGVLAEAPTHQTESLELNQQLMVSKTKFDSSRAINQIYQYVRGVSMQNRIAEDVMRNLKIDKTETIYLPVIVSVSSSDLSAETVNVQTPQSGNAKIDQAISVAVRDDALRAVNETEWSAPQEKDRKSIEAEYITFLANGMLQIESKSLLWNFSKKVRYNILKTAGYELYKTLSCGYSWNG